MLYSFGAREGEDRGVLETDLVAAVLAPGLTATLSSPHFMTYARRSYTCTTPGVATALSRLPI